MSKKPFWKSKTLWFNLLVAGLVALEESFSMLQQVFPANWYAILSVLLAVGNAILRVVSTAKLTK